MMQLGLTKFAGEVAQRLLAAGHTPHRKNFARGKDGCWSYVHTDDYFDVAVLTARVTIDVHLPCRWRSALLQFRLCDCGAVEALLVGLWARLGDWKSDPARALAAVLAKADAEARIHGPLCGGTEPCSHRV